MPAILDSVFQQRLEQVSRREWWPVTLLARTLGKPRMYIYRRIQNEDFTVVIDGGFMKVQSDSVLNYFEDG